MKKILSIVFLLCVVIVGVSGFYFWFSGYAKKLVAEDASSEVAVATNTPAIPEKPAAAINKLPKYNGQAINVIGDDPIIVQLPASAVAAKKLQLADLALSLSKNPNDFDAWMSLGNYKKFFNNFIGARDAWEYAKVIVREQPVVYLNLANLYAYYLNDHARAEINYLAAVSLDKLNVYNSLYSIANYYRDFGAKAKAVEYYQKALRFDPNNQPIKVEIQRLTE